MITSALKVSAYTLMNIRYSALILPAGVVAYLLQLYVLAVVAGILLAAAFVAEVALSIANGVEMHSQLEAQKRWGLDEENRLALALADIEKHANDWTNQHGSEAEAGPPEGEDPGEGQGPVPSR